MLQLQSLMRCAARLVALLVLLAPGASYAQSSTSNLNEDFTHGTTTNQWFFFNGACLTAGSLTGGSNPGQPIGSDYYFPGCTKDPYYTENLVGGDNGYLGATAAPAKPDTDGLGALRFTNGYPGGYQQNGAIVSASTFPTGQGLSVTFKTVTYLGDKQGGGKDGADGLSFYLLDGCMPLAGGTVGSNCGTNAIYGNNTYPGIGAWGGSLAYTCSNANSPYDGLIGGYLGLGIDEYGNFLNGTNNTLNETGSSNTGGDNTASGGYYQPGRIGLRGAGSIGWLALTTAYGTNPNSTGPTYAPYYPASLATTCSNGGVYSAGSCGPVCPTNYFYNSSKNTCDQCAAGTQFWSGTNTCNYCPTGGTYNVSNNTCTGIATCPSGGTYQPSTNTCTSPGGYCTTGQTYFNSTNTCHYCTTGTYVASSDSCMSCAVGSYVTSSGTCSPVATCSVGTYYPSGGTCNSCATGTYNVSNNTCTPAGTCSVGTYVSSSNTCNSCAGGATYNSSTNTCSPTSYCPSGTLLSGKCYTCSSGTVDTSSGTAYCDNICPSGYTYVAGTNATYPNECFRCSRGSLSGPAAGGIESCTLGGVLSATHFSAATGGSTTATLLKNAATANTPMTAAANPNTPMSGSPTVIAATSYTPTPIPPTTQAPTTSTPSTGVPYSLLAVQNTCRTGHLWNYSAPASPQDAGTATLPKDPTSPNPQNTAGILDYGALPGAYSVLPSTVQIANETATTRAAATPIFYNLKIAQNGSLTLYYSINGGAYTPVINGLNITQSNGPLPSSFRFGFAGSTGGSDNIHEIMCFKAAPDTVSASSVGVNEKQSQQIQPDTQAFFAYYDPIDSTGRVAAYGVGFLTSATQLSVATNAAWDASCNLTGVAAGSTCPTTTAMGPTSAQSPTASGNGRQILTWSGTAGVGFEWTGGISTAQQTALGSQDLLSYLRGDRTNEINSSGVGAFRARDGVLADIIDSSPTWVGPPSFGYTATFQDRLNSTDPLPENSTGSQTYVQFKAAYQNRQNVVYDGANDGFLHAFRTASDTGGGINDGAEVLAYIPGYVTQTIHNGTNPALDFSNPQYSHNYFVDATPGTGDLFYNGTWHTWLVGGLGAGGAAIYALDITDPTTFSESNAASLVKGEWTAGTDGTAGAITCAGNGAPNNLNCGQNLGNTYGTPLIRRLHNGMWGVIFGNGLGSATGDAGIYVMTVDPTTQATTFYYLSTGSGTAASPGTDGIAAPATIDWDGDKIVDYVYAGDLLGNLWRFDLTSSDPTKWAAGSTPVFSSPGQPITTVPIVGGVVTTGGYKRAMIAFGTGQRFPMTATNPITYLSSAQTLYGVWDWNMSAWNALGSVQFATLASGATGLSGAIQPANLQAQKVTLAADGKTRDIAATNVCFQGASDCGSGKNVQFGWSDALIGSSSQGSEQIVSDPTFLNGVIQWNSIEPADNIPTSCTTNTDKGWTYAVSLAAGAPVPNFFQQYRDDAQAGGVETDASGTSFLLNAANGTSWLVYQTVTNQHETMQVNLPTNNTAKRLTWIQLR